MPKADSLCPAHDPQIGGPGPSDAISDTTDRIMRALDDTARINNAILEEDLHAWQRHGSAPDHLTCRRQVVAMIDVESLGTLMSFAHPADVPVIFETLVELRREPAAVRLAAETLARQYLARGFEHIGRRIADVPLWQEPGTGDGPTR